VEDNSENKILNGYHMSEIKSFKSFDIMQNDMADDVRWMLMWQDLIGC
jgi:hypothetical protein